MSLARVITIAGSDSGGGAGIQADLKTFTALGVYGSSVITAVTAQNTVRVDGIHYIPASMVMKQLESIISDIGCDAIKIGMLASAEIIEVVVQAIKKYYLKQKVILDPVMISTSGHPLLEESANELIIRDLLPLSLMVTPNIAEAKILANSNKEVESIEDMKNLAIEIFKKGPTNVLVKGGHLPLTLEKVKAKDEVEAKVIVDILYDGSKFTEIISPFSKSKNTHGTGCTLSSAITAYLAKGQTLQRAVKLGIQFVHGAIESSCSIGQGHGPLNHVYTIQVLPFYKGGFVEYLINHPRTQKPWYEYTNHTFVQGLADGSLPISAFRYYLIQDYLFLTHFMRSNALAAYKTVNPAAIARSAAIVAHIEKERHLHVDFCRDMFGLSLEQLLNTPEDMANVAYTRWVIDIGHREDYLGLQVAMAACLIGYGAIGQRLYHDVKTKREGNPYFKWIETYAANDYTEAVNLGSQLLETYAIRQSPHRIEELVDIFSKGVALEIGFWDMGMQHTEAI